jgi:hypothetical protein
MVGIRKFARRHSGGAFGYSTSYQTVRAELKNPVGSA